MEIGKMSGRVSLIETSVCYVMEEIEKSELFHRLPPHLQDEARGSLEEGELIRFGTFHVYEPGQEYADDSQQGAFLYTGFGRIGVSYGTDAAWADCNNEKEIVEMLDLFFNDREAFERSERMKTVRQFRFSRDLLGRFDRVNEAMAVNGSEIVRRLIEDYVEKKEQELGFDDEEHER